MSVLKQPLITEKMNSASEKLRQYGFLVDKNANKLQVKKAVEEMYGVKVESVNTINYKGKSKTRFTRTSIIKGRADSFKKAIITLAGEDKIDFFGNI